MTARYPTFELRRNILFELLQKHFSTLFFSLTKVSLFSLGREGLLAKQRFEYKIQNMD